MKSRHAIWIALSDLYLDTQLQAHDLSYIRLVFDQSGLSRHQIRQINYEEVAPVLLANLQGMTGVWSGFDETWLINTIDNYLRKRRPTRPCPLRTWLWHRRVDYWTKHYLDELLGQD